MLFAGAFIVLACFIVFDISPKAFFLLVPTTLITFMLSLIIGHFLAEPLNALVKKIQATQTCTDVELTPEGILYEADELAKSIGKLVKKSQAQEIDLTLKARRQATFVSDVAHELRTPLTAIRGNAEMLTDPNLPPELHNKFCSIIVSESERLSRLTDDLLTLQRIEGDNTPLTLQRVNLKELAQNVVETLAPILRDRQAHTLVAGEAPDVLGNPDRLKQALTNLVENASRFIGPGGHITLELFGLCDKSVITIKDDGPGFGDANPKLLFDRFYRTDTSRTRGTGGSGLGLAIVKSVVEAHDGTVEAVNLPEGGAAFIIALPAIPIEAVPVKG